MAGGGWGKEGLRVYSTGQLFNVPRAVIRLYSNRHIYTNYRHTQPYLVMLWLWSVFWGVFYLRGNSRAFLESCQRNHQKEGLEWKFNPLGSDLMWSPVSGLLEVLASLLISSRWWSFTHLCREGKKWCKQESGTYSTVCTADGRAETISLSPYSHSALPHFPPLDGDVSIFWH